MYRKTFLSATLLLCCVGIATPATDYAVRKAASLEKCEAINPDQSESGLLMNPEGYRSYYVQSYCFQQAAVQFRDASVCDKVRRRFSLFSSSWGISTAQCRKLVTKEIDDDRAELEKEKRLCEDHPIRLRTFRINRNGNARDFDIIPEFSNGQPHGYRLIFEIVDAHPKPILLHSDGYYVDPNSQLRIFVRQAEIRSQFPEFELNRPYKVRATAVLSVPSGRNSGYWSDEFLESVFPLSKRSQSVTIETRF